MCAVHVCDLVLLDVFYCWYVCYLYVFVVDLLSVAVDFVYGLLFSV